MIFTVDIKPTVGVLEVTIFVDNEIGASVFAVTVTDDQSASRKYCYVNLRSVVICVESQRVLRCYIDELVLYSIVSVKATVELAFLIVFFHFILFVEAF